jgi:hypothetical protein
MLYLHILPKRTSRLGLLVGIVITLIVIAMIWRSFPKTMQTQEPFTELYTSRPVGPVNGENAVIGYTSQSSLSDRYGVYLYQIIGLSTKDRTKNVMKYVGGDLIGKPFSGKAGSYGWMIGIVKPIDVKEFKLQIVFDKNIALSDGVVSGPFTINSLNSDQRKQNGRAFIQKNVIQINFPTDQQQIMISLKYV